MLLTLLQSSLAPTTAQVTWLQSTPAFRLTADAGAFALAGPDAGLVFGGATVTARVTWLQGFTPLRLVADAGAFALAGPDAGLVFGGASATARVTWLQASTGSGVYQLVADSGAFVYSGAASLSDFEIAANGGSFGLGGGDAVLTRGGTPVVVGYRLLANPGTFYAVGLPVALLGNGVPAAGDQQSDTAYYRRAAARVDLLAVVGRGDYTMQAIGRRTRLRG